MGWKYLFVDFYTDHPFVDWYKTMQGEGHSQDFSKRIGFVLDDFQVENAASHKYVAQKFKRLWVARSEMIGH